MNVSIRLGDDTAQSHYPLPVSGRAVWSASNSGWQTSISLGDMPGGQIIVPSYSQLGAEPTFRFSLQARSTQHALITLPLHPVPHSATAGDSKNPPPATTDVSAHIDCWHTSEPLSEVQITLHIAADSSSSEAPQNYLLCLCSRALQIDPPTQPGGRFAMQSTPAAYSQMLAAADIRQRICSPTALAMALSIYPQPPSWPSTVEACFDPFTRAYGAWPLAIRWAARCGVLGAVETISDWHTAAQILQTGTPLVCSIRFDKDALRGAPLTHTGGHLVMLTAVDNEFVQIFDPAAPDSASVARQYHVEEFSQAWLQRRGAAYIFCNHQAAHRPHGEQLRQA